MTTTARIEALLQPLMNNDEYYVVDVQIVGLRPDGGHAGLLKVVVLVDSDAGVTIDACASISRQLGNEMEELDFFGDTPFNLEVSSPGVGFPLTQPRQYMKNVGRTLKVELSTGLTLTGLLTTVDEEGIVLDVPEAKLSKTKRKTLTELPPEGPQTLLYDIIQKATVEITF